MENSELDLIEMYLGGNMPPNEKQQFKERLRQDPVLAEALRSEQVMREALRRRHDEQMLARFRDQSSELFQAAPEAATMKPAGGRYRALALKAAAAIAVVLVAWWLIPTPPPSAPSAYASHYKRLEYTGDLSAGGQSAESQALSRAFAAYSVKNYEKTFQEAAPLTQTERYADWANLLIGSAQLEQNKVPEAVQTFRQVRQSALSLYNEAQWKIALAWLRAGQNDEAKAQLRRVASDSDNHFAAAAKKLLGEL
jgi:TolA-binding protein